jgi:hypothetical protein
VGLLRRIPADLCSKSLCEGVGEISTLLNNRRFTNPVSVTFGAIGWVGICCGTVVLVMGERDPALGVYGLLPTLLSLGILAAGGRLWSQSDDQGSLAAYVGVAFASAAGLIALVEVGSILLFHLRH